jgi:putative ATP-binding cassette transporter
MTALRQIWRLTTPFFTTRSMTTVEVPLLGRFRMQERWLALAFLAVVVGAEFGKVAINVRLS